MYKNHKAFIDPEKPYELLWRYMDWPRFFVLLKTKRLFFSSGEVLHSYDPFEGSLPKRELDIYLSKMPLDSVQRGQQHLRKEISASCWHYNDTESIAMWKLYAPTGNGIAIQTTIPEFKRAFERTSEDVYAGKVIYINYDTDTFYQDEPEGYSFLNGFVAFIHKRQQFEHEREYRAIVSKPIEAGQSRPGIEIEVDLSLLVKRVVVAPKTLSWMEQAVQSVLDELLPNVRAEKSIDDLTPIV